MKKAGQTPTCKLNDSSLFSLFCFTVCLYCWSTFVISSFCQVAKKVDTSFWFLETLSWNCDTNGNEFVDLQPNDYLCISKTPSNWQEWAVSGQKKISIGTESIQVISEWHGRTERRMLLYQLPILHKSFTPTSFRSFTFTDKYIKWSYMAGTWGRIQGSILLH